MKTSRTIKTLSTGNTSDIHKKTANLFLRSTSAALIGIMLASCGSASETAQYSDTIVADIQPAIADSSKPVDTTTKSTQLKDNAIDTPQSADAKTAGKKSTDIPANGTYRYDMAFAEFKGASRGEKVTIVIDGESIKVIYQGDGNLKTPRGTILDEGMIIKHKSGVYIISKNLKDAQADVVGGCSGGPNIIDFKNKKYHTC